MEVKPVFDEMVEDYRNDKKNLYHGFFRSFGEGEYSFFSIGFWATIWVNEPENMIRLNVGPAKGWEHHKPFHEGNIELEYDRLKLRRVFGLRIKVAPRYVG